MMKCSALFMPGLALALCLTGMNVWGQSSLPDLNEEVDRRDAAFEKVEGWPEARWLRGCLHTHSLWSDGNALPELVIKWYRDNGFAFMSLTDHSALQLGTAWRQVGKRVPQKQIDDSRAAFGDRLEIRQNGDKTEMRLLSLAELVGPLSEPGRFLLIPGHEINEDIGNRQLHMNVINTTETIPFVRKETIADSIRAIGDAIDDYGKKSGKPTFCMVNHPEWVHFSISPEDLIANPEIRFYELCNADSPPRPIGQYNKKFWDREKYWDVVLAYRLTDGLPPIYGAATDDAHAYFQPGAIASPGIGWVTVRTRKLTTLAIFEAMNRGDFYATTGIELDDLVFNPETGELTVKVASVEGVSYQVRFVGTKKNFDRTKIPIDYPEDQGFPARSGFTYSDEIGQTFAEISGPIASYTLKPDDLYVRAIVTSDRKSAVPARNKPENEILWTQPVFRP